MSSTRGGPSSLPARPTQVVDAITMQLYEQTMDAQEGVVYFLLEEMAQQRIKENLLAYTLLLSRGLPPLTLSTSPCHFLLLQCCHGGCASLEEYGPRHGVPGGSRARRGAADAAPAGRRLRGAPAAALRGEAGLCRGELRCPSSSTTAW